jgi:hypothetical protein
MRRPNHGVTRNRADVFSERRVCRLMMLAVTTYRYRSQRTDEPLRSKLVKLAREKPRFWYRRLHVLLQRSGERVNHKRLHRIYREAGLRIRRKKRKHCVREGSRCWRGLRRTRNGRWVLRTMRWRAGERSGC